MSSCRASKPTRALLGLATLAAVQMSIPARSASSNTRSRLPMRSQHFVSSVSTVAIPAQSATPSVSRRPPVPTTVAASSMPKKTADSILKHVERVSIPLISVRVPVRLGSSLLTKIATGSFVRLVPPLRLTRSLLHLLPPSRQCFLLPNFDPFLFLDLVLYHRLAFLRPRRRRHRRRLLPAPSGRSMRTLSE